MHFVVIAKGSVRAVATLLKHERVGGIEALDVSTNKFLEGTHLDPLMRCREAVRAKEENLRVFVVMPVVGFVIRVGHGELHRGDLDAETISRHVRFAHLFMMFVIQTRF